MTGRLQLRGCRYHEWASCEDDVYICSLGRIRIKHAIQSLGPEEITRGAKRWWRSPQRPWRNGRIVSVLRLKEVTFLLVLEVTLKGEKEKTFLLKERLLTLSLVINLVKFTWYILRVPHGDDGVVRDIKIFTRANGDCCNQVLTCLFDVYIAQEAIRSRSEIDGRSSR